MQVKRFRMETKAAKTLGIIVGGFIMCWLPFFTMYLVRAFCPNHIHPTVFSVLFWLGYCNSAINPCIYALFSKDFRFAFKRIICCKCSCIQRVNTLRRGSDGSQLAMRSVLQFTILQKILQYNFAIYFCTRETISYRLYIPNFIFKFKKSCHTVYHLFILVYHLQLSFGFIGLLYVKNLFYITA